jgi:transposase-like protein
MDESYFGGRRKGNWSRGAAGKIRYLVFWNAGEKSGLRLYRMSLERHFST